MCLLGYLYPSAERQKKENAYCSFERYLFCTGVSTRLHCMRVEEVLMSNETVDLLIYSLLDTYVVGGEKRSVLIILILT